MKDKRIKLCAICGKMPEIEVFNYYGSKGTYNVYTCCADYTYINLNAWNELQSSINKKIKKSRQEVLDELKHKIYKIDMTEFSKYGSGSASVLFNYIIKLMNELKKLKGDEK